MIYLETTVTAIGEEVPELLEGGVLVLYADGAPPALAEVSVQHSSRDGRIAESAPPVGARLVLGTISTRVSAVGESAWHKVLDIGHVVLNFNGAARAERPGEICVDPCEAKAVLRALAARSTITLAD
jgi:PTS system glucitol/sorbitol-specific IIA component